MIFQAKRYVRPNADVAQRHITRGFQYDLLSGNKCASAYVFYENGAKKIRWPLPPLIKPVSKVNVPPSRTAVLEDSLDLSSYLLRALFDDSFAMGASSPGDALRMIYGSAQSGQLSRLAVISSSGNAKERYEAALAEFREEIRNLQDSEDRVDPLEH